MKNCNMILREKLPKYQLYHQGKIDKYEYLTGKEILPFNQQQVIEQAKFTDSPLGKSFSKTNKKNWRSRKQTSWDFTGLKRQ